MEQDRRYAHVILYNDPQECYVGMDVFDTFELALAQFKARLRAVIDEYENGANCIDILIEDTEQRELRFRADDGYEVLYLCEEIQHTRGKE